MNAALKPDWLAEYEALTTGAGYVPLARTQIELTGGDRARFLHNLCTNEIRKLAAGAGNEIFLTSVQGKTLGHGFAFVGPDSIVLDSVAGQSETLLKHLDKYLVSEDVTITDRSADWAAFLISGAQAEDRLASLIGGPLPSGRLSHVTEEVTRVGWLSVRRVDITGADAFLLSVSSESSGALKLALQDAGCVECTPTALDAARIEQGIPLFGRDITDQHLPQEVHRDSLAISFVKGCYLGQETVARIDALGHVNKLLVGLRGHGPNVPEPGTEILADGQPVGRVTSATYSPRLGAPLALGYVKRGKEAIGTRLSSAAGDLEVIALPLT